MQIAISINRHHYAVDQYILIYVELSRYIDSSILRFCIDDYTVSSSWELGVRSTLRGRLAAIYCDMTSRAMVFLDTAEMNHLNLIRYLLSDELLISKLNRWKNAVDDMHSKQNYTLSMLDGYVTKLSMIVQNTYVV